MLFILYTNIHSAKIITRFSFYKSFDFFIVYVHAYNNDVCVSSKINQTHFNILPITVTEVSNIDTIRELLKTNYDDNIYMCHCESIITHDYGTVYVLKCIDIDHVSSINYV